MIDLHMHTTASDGTCTPESLVERAWHAGIRTMSVTDHDTMASVAPATVAAAAYGMTVIPGIEITASDGGRDVHVLAYFLSEDAPGLQDLLAAQRRSRIERAGEIAARLAALGAPIDVVPLLEGAAKGGGKSLARPQLARALVAAGGLASLAHPGQTKKDDLIPVLTAAGLGALEAYHSSHDLATQAHYLALAERHGIGVTGGSDYHGDGTRRSEFFGVTNLPAAHFEALLTRIARAGVAKPPRVDFPRTVSELTGHET